MSGFFSWITSLHPSILMTLLYICILGGVLSLLFCLSLALSVGGSWPRITVSVVEVARPKQHRDRGCCRGLGQGLLWASRFSWPSSRSLAENPCGQLVGVKTHSHSPTIPWTPVWRSQVTEQNIINISLINHHHCMHWCTLLPLVSKQTEDWTHTLTSQGRKFAESAI